MTKTAARFTLADIARATRAAKERGAEGIDAEDVHVAKGR
jgi:hypothetical protein